MPDVQTSAAFSAGIEPPAACEDHQRLFTSGAYVRDFQPESTTNPFARVYADKLEWILRTVGDRGLRVLDVGGGPGRMAAPLSQRHQVTLCDLSQDMLRLARRRPEGRVRRLLAADARELPFAGGSFDVVLCIDVLPHLPDPGPALREVWRVLAPGGTLIVDSTNSIPVWTLAYPRYVGRRPGRWFATWRAGGVLPEWRTRVWHRRRGEFLTEVAHAGFGIRSTHSFGPPLCPKWHLAVAAR